MHEKMYVRVRISNDSFFFFFFPGGKMDARRHTRGRIAPLLNQVLSEKQTHIDNNMKQ